MSKMLLQEESPGINMQLEPNKQATNVFPSTLQISAEDGESCYGQKQSKQLGAIMSAIILDGYTNRIKSTVWVSRRKNLVVERHF